MGSDHASSSTMAGDSPFERVALWVVVTGSRLALAAGIVGVLVAAVAVAIDAGLLAVGPDSSVPQVFGSGLVAGLLTLVTVALSINQLILSRVFGSPEELHAHLEGSQNLRRTVAEASDRPASPTSPTEFLSLTGAALADHARALGDAVDGSSIPDELREEIRDVEEYGDFLAENVDADTAIIDALTAVSGSAYAEHMAATARLDRGHGDRLPPDARTELETIQDLLDAVAISRQFFKTMTLQQTLASLSRIVAFTGFAAVFAAVVVALVYRSGGVTVPPGTLPVVVTVAVAVVLTPLATFVSFILRASTVARYTVSVGPFVPPDERTD